MNHSGLRPCVATFLTAVVVSVGLLSLSSTPAWAAAGTVTEFPIPTNGTPFDITAGPDGNLWFTDGAGEIGRITPSGSITEFPVPSGSFRITAGPDGNLWFTGYSTGEIGRITPGGSITLFPTPDGAWGITAGPDGNLWFADPGGNKIGRITTGGAITEFRIKTKSSFPVGITTGSDGNLWFTEEDVSKIGRITPGGSITEFALPTASAGNVIAYNGKSGVLVGASSSDTEVHVAINQNSMFANAGLGIDLAPQGVVNCSTPPPGPNDYTPCPVIQTATTTQVSGTASPNSTVEVFIASAQADDQGHGEGKTFLGRVTADAAGAWSLTLAAGQVSSGQAVTATATTSTSPLETSEFAANKGVS